MEETGVPGENDRPVASHRQTASQTFYFSILNTYGIKNMLYIFICLTEVFVICKTIK